MPDSRRSVSLGVEILESRSVFAAVPVVTLAPPVEPLIGEQASLSVTFDNASPTDAGYGPYVDLYLPANGIDGAVGAPQDGVTFVSATYLGQPVDVTLVTLTAGGVPHPFAVDGTGAPRIILPPPGFAAGDQLVVLRLPFGSFTADQAEAVIQVNVAVSNLADVGAALPIEAQGGFQFGNDSLDNPTTDAPIVGTTTSTTVTPELFHVRKEYVGPEDETTSGPNFERQYRIVVDVADGQTLTDLDLTDVLSDRMQFVGVVSVTNSGAPATVTDLSTPGTTTPGGILGRRLDSVTGTTSDEDAVLTFSFFVPLDDPSGAILPPATGAPTTTTDDSSAEADWAPIDPRDAAEHVVDDGPESDHTLTIRSIATQKTVSTVVDTGAAGPTPGDVLEYVLRMQVSDYFAFGNVVLTDLLSDGLVLDGTFTPTLHVEEHGVVTNAAFTSPNFSQTVTPGADTLVFDVSGQLVALGQDGRLLGGSVPDGGGPVLEPALFSPGTTVEIRFRARILDVFGTTPPSGNTTVKPGDVLGNHVDAAGRVLNTTTLLPTGSTATDDSDAAVTIVQGAPDKSVYAVNGAAVGGGVPPVTAGDLVTFRVQVELPTTSFQNLVLTDFLPLPLFLAGPLIGEASRSAAPPAENHAKYGPADSFFGITGIVPTFTVDALNNALVADFGDFNDVQNRPSTLDILFTLRVTNEPFADRLLLTNQIVVQQTDSSGAVDSQTAITQVQAEEPALPSITKGIVAVDDPAAVFDPGAVGPVPFSPPGAAGTRFTGTITTGSLAADPIDSDVRNLDAGDLVTFAIVVQNDGSGRNGAFDVKIRDTLPAGFVIPGGGAGLNLRVTDGTGAVFTFVDLGGGLFGNGIQLDDPGPTGVPAGALDPGRDEFGNVIDDGRNIVVVTYDLRVADTVQPGQTIVNTAAVFNFASTEGGPDFLGGQSLEDPAQATIRSPQLTKALVGTEIVNANNSNVEAVIGEIATYTVTLTIPEGEMHDVTLVDVLDSGLAFVDFVSVVSSGGVGFTGSGAPVVANDGGTAAFDLGTIVNGNRDDAQPDTITLTYRAVALNVAGNQTGTQLDNRVQLDYSGGPALAASAEDVVVIEPHVDVQKSAVVNGAGISGDAFDPTTYTIVVRNDGGVDAFDATLQDALPQRNGTSSLIAGAVLTSVVDTAGIVTAADFELVGDDSTGYVLRTRAGVSFDLAADPTRTITIRVDGTISVLATPAERIFNTALVRWTSLDGDPGPRSPFNSASTERTGAGGVDDYFNASTAAIQVTGGLTKSIVSTSEAATQGVSVAVGEIVRYRLTAQVPEGSSVAGIALRDRLPTGLQFLNDGTATVALVSDGALASPNIVDSAAYFIGNESTVGGVVPTSVFPAGAILGGAFGDGTDPVFDFGVLENLDDDPDQEFIVVEFNALVLNTAGNNDGTVLVNDVVAELGGVPIGNPSDSVAVVVQEPHVVIAKDVDQAVGDAGDRMNFTIVVRNDGAAPAFDVDVFDDLPPTLVLDTTSVVVTDLGGGIVGVDLSTSSRLEVLLNSLGAGEGVEITFTAIVQNSVRPDDVVTNTAHVVYTSLPGARGTLVNPTGSATPGGSGSANGERNGSGGINDYVGQDQAQFTIPTPDVDKSVLRTNVTQTGSDQFDPNVVDLAVGESVTFRLVVTLQEGTTRAILTDSLPLAPGLLELVGSRVVSIGSNITGSALAVGASGTPADTNADGLADQTVFDFGTLLNTPDNVVDSGDRIVVEVTARVADRPANVSGVRMTNTAVLNYQTGTATSTADVEVVEPRLVIDKSVTPGTGDAGDLFNYTVVVSHAADSTSAAFDLRLADLLPPNLILVAGTASTTVGTIVVGNDPGDTDLEAAGSVLELGQTMTLTFQARLGIGVAPNATVTNLAAVGWDGLPGTGGRFGAAIDTASVQTPGYTIDKELVGTSFVDTPDSDLAIGETATYALTVALPEGTAVGTTVVDVLPPGMTYVPGSATIDRTGFGGTVADPVATVVGNEIRFAFDPIVVDDDNVTTNNTFRILVDVRVDDVPGNVGLVPPGQTVLPNTASIQVGTGPVVVSPPVEVVVVEPDLNIVKDVDDSTVDGGQVVTYTVQVTHTAASTGPAYDVVVADPLAAGLELVVGSVTSSAGTVVVGNNPGDVSIEVDLSVLALNQTLTITYQARIAAPPTAGAPVPGDSITNTVDIDYDGTEGSGGRPRSDSDPAVVTLNSNSLSGIVWVDLLRNDVYDSEPLLAGVTITLTGLDHLNQAINLTTVTDVNGFYQFAGLRPGEYVVTETQPLPLVYLQGSDLPGSPFGNGSPGVNQLAASIPLGANAAGLNFDFNEVVVNALFGRVWQDLNDNGVLESGEPGIPGTTVTLVGVDDLGPVNLTTTTGVGGFYLFFGLRTGTYSVIETQPAAFVDGREQLGTVGGAPTGTAGEDRFDDVVLAQGNLAANYNFGELPPASISGSVYEDLDLSAARDPGEAGIGLVRVTLSGVDDLGGTVTATAFTDLDGRYTFGLLRPGEYTVTETQPAGYFDGDEHLGSPGGTAGDDVFSGIVLGIGQAGVDYDFGEVPPASLSGSVYVDSNNTGIREGGEAGIPSVRISLSGIDYRNRTVLAELFTDGDGRYAFTGLPPGVYSLGETQPPGFINGKLHLGSFGGTVGNDLFDDVSLPPAGAGVSYDFGELLPSVNPPTPNPEPAPAPPLPVPLVVDPRDRVFLSLDALLPPPESLFRHRGGDLALLGRLSGFVYIDLDEDGRFDRGEPGVKGVEATLVGATQTGGRLERAAETDERGFYLFMDLPPGTYDVTRAQPEGLIHGRNQVGTVNGLTSGELAEGDHIRAIRLSRAGVGAGYNFAELRPASVGGEVLRGDDDAKAVPYANAELILEGVDGLEKPVRKSVRTDAAGKFRFDDLPPGDYRLRVAAAADEVVKSAKAGGEGGAVQGDQSVGGIVLRQGAEAAGYQFRVAPAPAAAVGGR